MQVTSQCMGIPKYDIHILFFITGARPRPPPASVPDPRHFRVHGSTHFVHGSTLSQNSQPSHLFSVTCRHLSNTLCGPRATSVFLVPCGEHIKGTDFILNDRDRPAAHAAWWLVAPHTLRTRTCARGAPQWPACTKSGMLQLARVTHATRAQTPARLPGGWRALGEALAAVHARAASSAAVAQQEQALSEARLLARGVRATSYHLAAVSCDSVRPPRASPLPPRRWYSWSGHGRRGPSSCGMRRNGSTCAGRSG